MIADNQLRHAAEEGERIDMSADPIGQPLGPARLGKGVVRGPQNRDAHVSCADLPSQPVDHRHRVAGEVDEQLLAGHVGLPHRRRDALAPLAIELAEPAVALAVGMLARYSCHSSIRVTPRRRSSACIPLQSGCGRVGPS
jgi:hypothetical protein